MTEVQVAYWLFCFGFSLYLAKEDAKKDFITFSLSVILGTFFAPLLLGMGIAESLDNE